MPGFQVVLSNATVQPSMEREKAQGTDEFTLDMMTGFKYYEQLKGAGFFKEWLVADEKPDISNFDTASWPPYPPQ